VKEPTEFFHKSDQNLPTGYFVKQPTRFFHKLPRNVTTLYSTIYSMGSLRVCCKVGQIESVLRVH